MNSAPRATPVIIALLAAIISCAPKPLAYFEPPQGKALLYHLPMAYPWINKFPHNSLQHKTTLEICERESWFEKRSSDLDKDYSKFKTLVQNGDEIWIWSGDSAGMFDIYRGIDVPTGICIIRRNKIIAVIMTQMTCNIE